jgi:general secretion pathway protein A
VYESFYGLSATPFQLNPDPAFFYGSKQHSRAMAYLEYGLYKNEGFIVITGEIGAGKTTVLRNLISKIDAEKMVAVQLVSTQLNADDMLCMVAASFGLPATATSKSEMLLSIEAYLIELSMQGKRALLIVDEAQNLTLQAMEELRMLSNYQLGEQALLQSFLVAQPEFRAILESPQMEQLRQRVVVACHISPLDLDETRRYIEHRLTHVGWEGRPQFAPGAYERVFAGSGGVPRRINSICDRVLLGGFLAGTYVISEKDVEEAVGEINSETRVGAAAVAAPKQRVNGSDSMASLRSLDTGIPDLDLSRIELVSQMPNGAAQMMSRLQLDDFEERLARLERMNAAAIAILRRLVDSAPVGHSPKPENE